MKDDLFARTVATERMVEALVLALDESGVLPITRALESVRLMQLATRMVEGETAAEWMQPLIDRLQIQMSAARETGGRLTPQGLLRVQIFQFAAVGPENRAALQAWMQIATTEELSDDLQDALRAFAARHGDGKKRSGEG